MTTRPCVKCDHLFEAVGDQNVCYDCRTEAAKRKTDPGRWEAEQKENKSKKKK